MPQPATTTELLLQQIADSNKEIVDLLRQGHGPGGDDRSASGAPSPAPGAASQGGRRPARKSTTPRGGKGREVRGD